MADDVGGDEVSVPESVGDIDVIDVMEGGDAADGSAEDPEEDPPPHDAQPTAAARMAITSLIAVPPRCYLPAMVRRPRCYSACSVPRGWTVKGGHDVFENVAA